MVLNRWKNLLDIRGKKIKVFLVLILVFSASLFIYLKLEKLQTAYLPGSAEIKINLTEKSPGNVVLTCSYRFSSINPGDYRVVALYAMVLYENQSGIYVYWVPQKEGCIKFASGYGGWSEPVFIPYYTREFRLDKPGKYYFMCVGANQYTAPPIAKRYLPLYQEQWVACVLDKMGRDWKIAFNPKYNLQPGYWVDKIARTTYYKEGTKVTAGGTIVEYFIFKDPDSNYYYTIKYDGDELDADKYTQPSYSGWCVEPWDLSYSYHDVDCFMVGFDMKKYEFEIPAPYTSETEFRESVKKSILDKILELIAKIIEQLFKLLRLE